MNNPESQKSHESSDSPNQWSSLAEEPSFEEHMANKDSQEDVSYGFNKSKDYFYREDEVGSNIYRNVNRIDISTEQGKYEWLDALWNNAHQRELYELEEAKKDGENEIDIAESERELKKIEIGQKVLLELISPDEDSIFDALNRERNAAYEKWINMNDNASAKSKEHAEEKFWAIDNLFTVLSDEMSRRDPNFFNHSDIQYRLKNGIEQAERKVQQSMADGYFGEDGFIHKSANGEKFRTILTEDAEIDLDRAKQDAETYEQLHKKFYDGLDYDSPYWLAAPKSEFGSLISKYIDEHSDEIDKLNLRLKGLEKETPEYQKLVDERRKLAKERSSAKRLLANYFS
jgi:hypothetical protein